MKNSWAISGVDLHLATAGDRDGDGDRDRDGTTARSGSLRERIEAAIRDAVVTERLAAGTRLPSSRGLAADLGVARNTVADAYAQLVAEGWLEARQGSGTRVAESGATWRAVPPVSRPDPASPRYDLSPGSPDVSSFPRSAWLSALRRALAVAPHSSLGYGDPRGVLPLRRELAGYLGRARGVRTAPDRLVVCSGTTQAVALLAEVLAPRCGTVAVEEVGLVEHRDVIARRGPATTPLPVDADGARVGLLPGAAAGAALLTPAHQFPLGVALSAERRLAAVAWARDAGGVLVEDDYDGEFRYDRQPVGALQALDPELVVYCGTTSKSLGPAVRLGWLALPEALVDDVVEAKRLTDHQTSILNQLALVELLRGGRFDRHVRRRRLAYRRRRDALAGRLRQEAPAVTVTGIAAGLHLLVELPGTAAEAADVEADLVARARRRGLAVGGLRGYAHPGATPRRPALVVGYGTPGDHAFPAAVEILCRLLGGL